MQLALAFGAGALTHPVVWFVIPWLWYDALGQRSYWLLREHGGKVAR